MKKIICTILALVLISIIPAQAFANENELNCQTFVVNEEKIIEQLKKSSDEELHKMGYTTQQIEEIRKFDYFEALSARAKLDDETLTLYNYSPDEIQELREYVASGGRAKGKINSNSLKITLKFDNITKGKQANGTISWEWTKTTLIQFIDCVAVAWKTTSGSTINYSKNTNNFVSLTLTKINPNVAGAQTTTATKQWSVKDNQSIYANIPIGTYGYFAFKGSGKFTIKSTSGTFNEFYIDCAYAHYTISATPNISISDGKTNLSISFKGGLNDDMHIKRIYNASFNIVEDY